MSGIALIVVTAIAEGFVLAFAAATNVYRGVVICFVGVWLCGWVIEMAGVTKGCAASVATDAEVHFISCFKSYFIGSAFVIQRHVFSF